jgi:AraC-like DNA-binding protein
MSERIASHLAALVRAGFHMQTVLGGVDVFDTAPWNARMPAGTAGIVILCSREDHACLEEDAHPFTRPHYFVQTALTSGEPSMREPWQRRVLGLSIRFDLQVAAELILALDEVHGSPRATRSMPAPMPLDKGMADAVLRLLQALPCPADALVLGPAILRELLYRVLTGAQGGALRSALCQQGNVKRIAKALRRIREGYAGAVDVAALANEAGMSVAAFHAHFKMVTQTTPIQFLKTTRLRQARLLMMRDGVGAANASRLVGYESTSQFSREFKRLFGRTPTQEAARMKAALYRGEAGQAEQGMQPDSWQLDYHATRNSEA